MPLIVPNFVALGQTMYEKSVTKVFPRKTPVSQEDPLGQKFTNVGPDVWAPFVKCQILSRSDSPSTRYLLPNFVHFVDGVTDTKTVNMTYIYACIPCGDNKQKD